MKNQLWVRYKRALNILAPFNTKIPPFEKRQLEKWRDCNNHSHVSKYINDLLNLCAAWKLYGETQVKILFFLICSNDSRSLFSYNCIWATSRLRISFIWSWNFWMSSLVETILILTKHSDMSRLQVNDGFKPHIPCVVEQYEFENDLVSVQCYFQTL